MQRGLRQLYTERVGAEGPLGAVVHSTFCDAPQALPCKPMARGRGEWGAAGDLVCSLGTAGEGQDAVSYLAWRAASPGGSGAGMASVGCRENRLR